MGLLLRIRDFRNYLAVVAEKPRKGASINRQFRYFVANFSNIMRNICMELDETDRKLLRCLQANAQMTAAELADAVNLSPSQAARRRQRLEAEGIVTSYRASLSPAKVGLGVEAFIQVVMATHTAENAKDFLRVTRTRAEIVGAWTLTGEADYLLRVFCEDLAALNNLVQTVLLPHPAVSRVHSQIVMERVKPDAPLPV